MSYNTDELWVIADTVSDKVYDAGYNGYSTKEEHQKIVKANYDFLVEELMESETPEIFEEAEEEMLEQFASELENENFHSFNLAFQAYMFNEYGIVIDGYDPTEAPYLHETD